MNESCQECARLRRERDALLELLPCGHFAANLQPLDDGCGATCVVCAEIERLHGAHKPSAVEGPFEQFWRLYPRKTGKGAARKSFVAALRSHPTLTLRTLLDAVKWQAQTEQWRKDAGAFIPMPATWLNQERWLDEPTKTHKKHEPKPPPPTLADLEWDLAYTERMPPTKERVETISRLKNLIATMKREHDVNTQK